MANESRPELFAPLRATPTRPSRLSVMVLSLSVKLMPGPKPSAAALVVFSIDEQHRVLKNPVAVVVR